MTRTTPAAPVGRWASEPRQLALVALCSLALVLAAFAAPPTAQGASPPDLPNLFGDESRESSDCVVTLSEDPVPGRDVTATVYRRGEPVDGVRVWFDDRVVGTTDPSGEVEGEVPYVESLRIAVALPGGGSCEFVTGTDRGEGTGLGTEAEPRPGLDAGPARAGLGGRHLPTAAGVAPASISSAAAQQDTPENVTGTYGVDDAIDVRVEGRTDPGATVTLVATIDGDPVPDATVSVAGREVGETDSSGRHAFRVPDDGSSTVAVAVQRGELRTEETVDVRVLQAVVRGGQFPLPGQSATLEVTIGDEAVDGAAVTLAGERVGTTDASGELRIDLPADPTASVTVTAGDRTARTSVLSVFAPTVVATGVVLSLVLGGPLLAYWIGGRRGVAVVVGVATNALTAAAGYAVAGRDGAILAAVATVLLVALVLVVRRPAAATAAGESAGSAFEGLLDRVTDDVLWLTRRVEAFVDQTRASVASLVDDLRGYDPAAAVAALRDVVVAIPGFLAGGLFAVIGLPGRLVAGLRAGAPSDDADDATDRDGGDSSARGTAPPVRQLWRRFARAVAADRWPRRTPGEVSRRAIDDGFPRDAVVELTSVFRDVEYGGERLSDDRYRRARTAFDALGLGGDGGTTPDGGVDDGEDDADGDGPGVTRS